MTELDPIEPGPPTPLRRDRRMLWTAGISAAIHLLILGALFLPRVPVAEAAPPDAVNVDVLTPSQLASLESSASSEPPSSQAPSSSQPPSSDDSSSEPQSAEPSSQPSASAASSKPAASAPVSSQPRESSEESASEASSAASSEPPPPSGSSASASAEPSSAEASISESSARPVVPVGPDTSSDAATSEASSPGEASTSETSAAPDASEAPASVSAASDAITSILTAAGGAGGADASSAEASASSASAEPRPVPPRPLGGGALHAAKEFYLKQMLQSPGLAQAKAGLKQLSPERRLAQTCNIEAYGQAGHAGYAPDAIVANAFAPPVLAGVTYTVTGGAFRSEGSWRRIAYQCTLSKDMSAVASFSYHIGADVTETMTARLNGGGG